MDLTRHIIEALINLSKSKLRSFLAILGILVGTGSVVALITSSQLATAHALAQFKTLGTNMLAMDIRQEGGQPKSQQHSKLKLKDIAVIKNASPDIEIVAPYTYLYQSAYYKGKSLNSQATLGADKSLVTVAKMYLAKGRYVSLLDRSGFFCDVGSNIAKQMRNYGAKKIIGNQIRIGRYYLTVVGILKPWKPNFFLYAQINNGIIIPIETSFLMSKYSQITSMLVRFKKDAPVNDVKDALQGVMAGLLPTEKVSFRTPEQIIKVIKTSKATYNNLLIFVGSISLIVGAIGVMNIMLVSVVERRREIGVRMAIGAQGIDIMLMFLIEAIVLTVFGGIVGILIGLGFSYALAYFSGWEFKFFLLPPVLGFVVSVMVGIISGFYPAWQASRLDPIETLQSE